MNILAGNFLVFSLRVRLISLDEPLHKWSLPVHVNTNSLFVHP